MKKRTNIISILYVCFLCVIFMFGVLVFSSCDERANELSVVGEITINKKSTRLPDILLGGEKSNWDNFYYTNNDGYIYVFDGKIEILDTAPQEFSTELELIYKYDESKTATIIVTRTKVEIRRIKIDILSEKIYPGSRVYYSIHCTPSNAVLVDYEFSIDQPEYLQSVTEDYFVLADDVPVGTEICINVSIGDTLKAKATIAVDDDIYEVHNIAQLRRMESEPYGYFKLMTDIDLGGYSWKPVREFYGVLDGNGYSIRNISYTISNNGLYGLIVHQNHGTIKDLQLLNCSLYEIDDPRNNRSNSVFGAEGISLYVGGVCGINQGLIENVLVSDIELSNLVNGTLEDETPYGIYVGAITGINTGEITRSGAISNKIEAKVYSYLHRATVCAGGVCGYNRKKIENSYAYNNNIFAYTYGVQQERMATSRIRTKVGGLIGCNQGSADRIVAASNKIDAGAVGASSDWTFLYVGSIIGTLEGSVSNSYVQYSTYNPIGNDKVSGVKTATRLNFEVCSKLDKSIWQLDKNRIIINHSFKEVTE